MSYGEVKKVVESKLGDYANTFVFHLDDNCLFRHLLAGSQAESAHYQLTMSMVQEIFNALSAQFGTERLQRENIPSSTEVSQQVAQLVNLLQKMPSEENESRSQA